MKALKILLISLSISLTMAAQDDNYKGPAKMDVKTFWRQAEMFKNGKGSDATLGNMKKALSGVKEKDPSYNTSIMEEEMKKCQSGIDSKNEAAKTEEQKATDKKMEEVGYNGPAKRNVESFWQNGSKSPDTMSENELNVAIGNMNSSLKWVKEKDPTYSTSEMEATIEKFKTKRKELQIADANKYTGDKVKDSQQNQSISKDPGKLFEELFEDENMQTGAGSSTGAKWKRKLENYNEKVTKLLSMDYNDAKISHTRMSKGIISGLKMKTDKTLGEIDVMLSKYTDKESMEIGYYTIQFHMAYWDAASKVFSEEVSYKEMYNKVKTASDKMGSLESMKTKADGNQAEKIKNTKLPGPVAKDAALEKVLIDGFNKTFSTKGAIALKAVLTQDGWTTLRNPLTSVIVGRERSARVAYKDSDGKCYLLEDYVFIHEEYIGGSFTNVKAVYNGLFGLEMLCENIK
ncbi:MAG: hypothetical protein JNJ40_00450 [Bacteroidia bacterium]|nr:hypothetical protein [Bacteroidia bacterium]